MAGLCGVIGRRPDVGDVANGLEWTTEETTTRYRDDCVALAGSFPTESEADQPVSVGTDSLLWVWGNVFGHDGGAGYQPRTSVAESDAAYCAALYERYGTAFVSGLNGDFVGVVYDRRAGTVSVFTDRLGLRDTYYVQPTDDTLVFSTAVQSLSRHPAVTPSFDPAHITEYVTSNFRTFGLRTPLEGTHRFHPGAITPIDTSSLAVSTDRYWTPRYRPRDRPFSAVLDEFASRLEAAVTERLQEGRRYGLLLSGGVDSRLVLAAVDGASRGELTAYHTAGWKSREARTAERVADAAGIRFELLERDVGYHERALARNPKLSNFVGTFEQAHLEGFMPEIRAEVDEMLTASFADSNFKAHSFPQHRIDFGPLGTLHLPLLKPMDTIDRYVDFWTTEPPAYLRPTADPARVFRGEIHRTNAGVDHHGVTYGSPEELFTCGMLTPRTNGSVLFMLQSLRQHLPAWSPFVDNRLVDLYLTMPKRFFVRRNVVLRAIERLDPDLADVPYADSGLPPRYPFPAHLLGEACLRFADRNLPVPRPPAPHLTNGSWPDAGTLIRQQSFVRDALIEKEGLIRQLPFLDWDGVRECFNDHLAGAENERELYGLLTLLEMPVTQRVAEAGTS